MKKNNLFVTLCFLVFTIFSCKSQVKPDQKILEPDKDEAGIIHGYNYTSLGLLTNLPWEYLVSQKEINDNSYYKNGLMFELQEKGKLKFWFKSDYLESVNDTITLSDGNISISTRRAKSSELKIANIYDGGWWTFNEQDSSIVINFGKNQFKISELKGKLIELNIERACILISERKERPVKICLAH